MISKVLLLKSKERVIEVVGGVRSSWSLFEWSIRTCDISDTFVSKLYRWDGGGCTEGLQEKKKQERTVYFKS